jgi:hypothetical protein
MRKSASIGLLLVILAMAGTAFAQRGTAETTINGKTIAIDYGRPSLQGRDMLGRLPVGQSWRMGMNAATTLTTQAPLRFGDLQVPVGKHTLTLKRISEDSFHLVITPDGGSPTEVPVETMKLDDPVETLTMGLESQGDNRGHFALSWGTLAIGTDFTVE